MRWTKVDERILRGTEWRQIMLPLQGGVPVWQEVEVRSGLECVCVSLCVQLQHKQVKAMQPARKWPKTWTLRFNPLCPTPSWILLFLNYCCHRNFLSQLLLICVNYQKHIDYFSLRLNKWHPTFSKAKLYEFLKTISLLSDAVLKTRRNNILYTWASKYT